MVLHISMEYDDINGHSIIIIIIKASDIRAISILFIYPHTHTFAELAGNHQQGQSQFLSSKHQTYL